MGSRAISEALTAPWDEGRPNGAPRHHPLRGTISTEVGTSKERLPFTAHRDHLQRVSRLIRESRLPLVIVEAEDKQCRFAGEVIRQERRQEGRWT